MKQKIKQNAGNFGQPDRVLPQYQYGGNMKQNASGGDAYDFGSSVLQNYAAMQEQRQQQEPDDNGEIALADNVPVETDTDGSDTSDQQQDPNKFAIPDANYFAQKEFEYTGQTQMQDQINELQAQIMQMQSNQGLGGNFNYDVGDGGDDEDSDEGTIPDYHYTASVATVPTAIPPAGTTSMPKGSKGSAAIRHNNPGNIKFGDFAKGFDAEQGDMSPEGNPFAYFPTIEKGLQAQRALLKGKTYRNLTVEQAMNRWITGNPNQPGIYAKRAAAMFNNRKISELSDSELQQLQNFMIKNEDKDMAEKLHLVQSGGKVPVAQSYADKYHGLNNDTLNELLIKNNGYNQYRGLDSGKPVHLYDDLGASTVLFGPDDMATLYGNVYENRMQVAGVVPNMSIKDPRESYSYGTYKKPYAVLSQEEKSAIDRALKVPASSPQQGYTPSQATTNLKTGLTGLQVATAWNPLANELAGGLSAGGDLYTAGRYALDGQWANAGIDVFQAALDLVPYLGKSKYINLAKGAKRIQLDKDIKAVRQIRNLGLKAAKAGSDAETVKEAVR
jgi:hypothetical protein